MPDLVVILFEGNIHSYRQIFLDGRGHPKDLNPTWYISTENERDVKHLVGPSK